jgi:branched-chain amino acid transport system substrate-binding protein
MRGIGPFLTMIVAAALTLLASDAAWSAEMKYSPGVSDTEIKIGPTIAYSGPASSFGTVGHTISAYYRMINDRGGINGRKINFISADDGYSPPKTVEQTAGSSNRTRYWRSSDRSAVRPMLRSSAI